MSDVPGQGHLLTPSFVRMVALLAIGGCVPNVHLRDDDETGGSGGESGEMSTGAVAGRGGGAASGRGGGSAGASSELGGESGEAGSAASGGEAGARGGVGGAPSGGAGAGGKSQAGSSGSGGTRGGNGQGGKGQGGASPGGNGGAQGGVSGNGGGSAGASMAGAGGSGGALPCGTGGAPYEWANWCITNAVGDGPHPPSFDTGISGVVRDLVTGLVWEQSASGTYPLHTFGEADSHCADLRDAAYGGYDDWRVPSRIELVSIVDYSRFHPAIDAVAFPLTPFEGFWTSRVNIAGPSQAWLVDFEYGVVAPVALTTQLHVRCVR